MCMKGPGLYVTDLCEYPRLMARGRWRRPIAGPSGYLGAIGATSVWKRQESVGDSRIGIA